MKEVEFDDNRYMINRTTSNFRDNQQSKLEIFVLKTGIVKNKAQAQYFLIGISLVILIISFLVLKFFSGGEKQVPTYREDIPESVQQNLPESIYLNIPSKYAH